MDIVEKTKKVELMLHQAGVTLPVFIERAGIDRSTWARWRSGATIPRTDRWNAACIAAASLCARELAAADFRFLK